MILNTKLGSQFVNEIQDFQTRGCQSSQECPWLGENADGNHLNSSNYSTREFSCINPGTQGHANYAGNTSPSTGGSVPYVRNWWLQVVGQYHAGAMSSIIAETAMH